MNNSNLNQQRLFIIIAASLGILSVFLPWSEINIGKTMGIDMGGFGGQSANGFSSLWGMLTFLCFAACIVISVIGNKTELLERKPWSLIIASGGAAFLFTVISILLKPNVNHPVMNIESSVGMGVWMSLIAAAGIVGVSWHFKKPEDSLADGFDTLKKEIVAKVSSASFASGNNNVPKENNTMEEIEKLFQMKEKGIITEEDFKIMKQKLMSSI